jgi:hypothetical protein
MMRFQFLIVASMKILIAVMMEAVDTSETLLNLFQTIHCNIPENIFGEEHDVHLFQSVQTAVQSSSVVG